VPYFKLDEVNRQAHGRWSEILMSVGGLTGTQVQPKKYQGCPICGGKDRYNYDDYEGNGNYFCRGCDAGNGWTMLTKKLGIDFKDALQKVGEYLNMTPEGKPVVKKATNTLAPIIPAPKKLKYKLGDKLALSNKDGTKEVNYSYEFFWEWVDADGKIVGYIGRTKKKITHQIYWTQKGWTQGSIGNKRPPFGMQSIKGKDTVLVVEGEKVWAKVNEYVPDLGVVSWVGGSNVPHMTDWRFLHGKEVILFPDNDEQGHKAADKIAEIINGNANVYKVNPPSDKPEGWDLADAIDDDWWIKDEILNYINDNKFKIKSSKEESKDVRSSLESMIKPLGYNEGKIYVMPHKQLQIREVSMSDLGPGQLRALLATDIWASIFSKKEGCDWAAAADWLIRSCEEKGVYTPNKIRGRGVWKDGASNVVHLGNKLVVDSKLTPLTEFNSPFIYPRGMNLTEWKGECFTEEEKDLIYTICHTIQWLDPLAGHLLLGYLACAPICGILSWRPHIWITGPAGVGKSTILRDVVAYLMGDFCLQVEGETSEAGIRQTLKADALPVLFDEPETNDERDLRKVQRILGLMRIASTDSGARVLKGTSGHEAIQFDIRSMFCMASINIGIKNKADETRCSVLELKPKVVGSQDNWEILKSLLHQLNPDMSRKLFYHSATLSNVITANAAVFSDAIAELKGSKRLGDQYGTLTAGAYTFQSDKVISKEDAMEYINDFNWQVLDSSLETTQEENILETVKSLIIEVAKHEGGSTRLTINELINLSTSYLTSGSIVSKNDACETLARYGIKTSGQFVWLANNNDNLKKQLKDTPAVAGWNGFLKRLPGAVVESNAIYFHSTCKKSRCLKIPISFFLEKEPIPHPSQSEQCEQSDS